MGVMSKTSPIIPIRTGIPHGRRTVQTDCLRVESDEGFESGHLRNGRRWGNPRNITNHLEDDEDPAWLNPVLSVAPAGKKFTTWGRLKQVDR